MFFQALDLTSALRPELSNDESLLFVQDGVGLYEGEYKIPDYQNGHVYLTSHRICYVDNAEPRRKSVSFPLKSVDRYEYYAGFLKSSAKVTIHPKSSKGKPLADRTRISSSPVSLSPSRKGAASPAPTRNDSSSGSSLIPQSTKSTSITWICPICSFSNILPSNFDPTTANEYTALPPCQTCGIKPPLTHLLKAAISSAVSRPVGSQVEPIIKSLSRQDNANGKDSRGSGDIQNSNPDTVTCSRCTFENHSSLLSCEICGSSLVSVDTTLPRSEPNIRTDSPGPTIASKPAEDTTASYVKISFRARGDKIFYERLKGAMVQRKWLLENAPPVPQSSDSIDDQSHHGSGSSTPRNKGVGIAGLEQRGLERSKNNENVISSAFEDLEALMASAKEMIALAESLSEKIGETSAAKVLNDKAVGLGMTATKDMLDSASSDSLYLSELSRSLAEYLTDDSQAVLKREGGVMSLVDFWAEFNRRRHGVELISPSDFGKAARMWEKLGLPVRLREFRNGLLVVQRHDWTDDKTIAQLLTWLQELQDEPPKPGVEWDQQEFGRGVTAQETAVKFGWSVGVATEELQMAEEKGVLCREEGIEGLKFWENIISMGFT